MLDTVNLWNDRVNILGDNPFNVLPFLSDVTERINAKTGYSCIGKILNYIINVYESGILLRGSLCKSLYGDNLHTLTRLDTKQAIEQISDYLHTDIKRAKVTRLDVSTIIPTRYPPANYYHYLGSKPYFKRLQATPNTLYYNNHQRQIIFYDKIKEANSKEMKIPAIWQNSNLLRYELRYIKHLNKQINTNFTAAILSDEAFYHSIIQNWYDEFLTIQKLKKPSFMIENISTPKEAEEALFAYLLQQTGQGTIDGFLSELKAKNVFPDKKYYSRVKTNLNRILAAPCGEQSDLMQELETAIFNVAKYAR